MHDYIRPRNASFLFDAYSHKVGVGEKYDEKTLFVQINFTYWLGNDTKYFNKEDARKIENSLKEEYREEGLSEGRIEGIKETAKKMKNDGLDLQTIARYTNLTIDEITRL